MAQVSVLVPSYNHAPFVERALRSIFAQTLQPKKLIVIDDGSRDDSVRVIEKTLAGCPFESEFIARENRGLCRTLNEGFARASGDYFAYLGSDDVWLPGFLEKRIRTLRKRPNAVLAFGHCYVINERDEIVDSTENWTEFADGDMLPLLLRGQMPSSPSVVYPRAVLEKERWNEKAKLEDYELYLKLSVKGEFAFDPEVLCAWRQHGWNTSSNFPTMFQEWIAAQKRVAGDLQISSGELDKIQKELKFNAAFDYIRYDHRLAAIRLMSENIGGAKSFSQVARILLRLCVPPRLFRWNRRRKRKKSAESRGKLTF